MGIIPKMYRILVFIFLLANSFEFHSQNDDSTYVNENGQTFLIHIVKKGETAFGISKKHNLDLNVFFELNPEASNGLQLDQKLKIPFKIESISIVTDTVADLDTLSKKHLVQEGETYWSISNVYSVSIDNLKKVNGLNNEPLQIGQSLIIPSPSKDTTNTVKPIVKNPVNPLGGPCDSIFFHKVRKKETLYSISKFYNVPISSIKEVNNGLINGLKKGEDIRISVRKIDCNENDLITDTIAIIPGVSNYPIDSIFHVSLMLPFMLDENDTIQQNCPPLEDCDVHVNSVQSIHFYNGILLAIDSLRKAGLRVKLSLFDTENDTSSINKVFSDSNFLNSNLVIGPIYLRNIKKVTDFCKAKNIHVICPVPIPNQALFNNTFVTRLNPSKQTMMKQMAKYNLTHPQDINRVMVVNSKLKKDISYSKAFKSYYNSNLTENLDSLSSIYLNSSSNLNQLKKYLKPNVENIIIVPSSNMGFVSNFMTRLSGLINTYEFRKYQFTIYGMEEWKEMQTIDEKYKNSFNLHLPLSGKVDYSSTKTIDFINNYREKYSFEPDKFSFIGFDIAYNSFKGLMLYDGNISEFYKSSDSFHQGYYFKSNVFQVDIKSGFENKGVYIYHYKDYQLIRLD